MHQSQIEVWRELAARAQADDAEEPRAAEKGTTSTARVPSSWVMRAHHRGQRVSKRTSGVSHAAVAYADAKKIDGLSRAIESRDLIGQAKGILMERYQIDAVRAFNVLTRISQTTHARLRDVSHELVTTGRIAALEQT